MDMEGLGEVGACGMWVAHAAPRAKRPYIAVRSAGTGVGVTSSIHLPKPHRFWRSNPIRWAPWVARHYVQHCKRIGNIHFLDPRLHVNNILKSILSKPPIHNMDAKKRVPACLLHCQKKSKIISHSS